MLLPVFLFFLHLVNGEVPWWKSSILYQVYPRSFADSDGDGNGDIRGIIQHVPYLKDIGVGVVWLSPVFASPGKDMGYDISDYRSINPMFGTIADLEELISEVHKNGMKLLLDFVPNHTSDEHVWFNSSRYKVDGKDDYYVWEKPISWENNKPQPPNNWMSLFGGSAWTYDEVRKQFYLHQFGSYQPDLNYRNKAVLTDMLDNMKFWIDKGVDGFRVDAVPFLIEDSQLRNEPVIPNCKSKLAADCLQHIYTQNLPETYETLKSFDELLQQYENTNPKFFFLEAYADRNQTMKYYAKHSSPFNFELISKFKVDSNATHLKEIVDWYMSNMKGDLLPNWVAGNHDNSRTGTRFGEEMVDVMNMLVLMLPGASVTYYGEEIGMLDTFVRPEERFDSTGRDPERTPMQWNRSMNAGFSRSPKSWLPVNPNYYSVNVESELESETSHLKKYKRLAEARKDFADSIEIQTAKFGDWIFAFKRSAKKKEYYVVVNLNNVVEEITLKEQFNDIPSSLTVHTASSSSAYNTGDKVETNSKISLAPRSAMYMSSAATLSLKLYLALMVSAIWCYIFGKTAC